jgi:hypothetical protein
MTSVLVPDEAAGHLGAIFLAFNREIFSGFLDEAEELAALGMAASAVLIAGTVLEYFERSPTAVLLPLEQRREIGVWRQLRNQVAHGSAGAPSVQQAQQVIDRARQILQTHYVSGGPVRRLHTEPGHPLKTVKGKYACVRTSSDDFIKRKGEELELEDRGYFDARGAQAR